MDVTQIRNLFPVTRNYVYLNHAAVSPLSTRVSSTMAECIADMSQHGTASFEKWLEPIEEARRLAAELIGASPEEVAFTKNTTSGLLIVATGLDWKAGDNVVSAETEFPANVFPWVNLQRLGVETRLTPSRDGRILVEDIAAQMDERTRLVALSFVEFGTGYRNDLAAVGELCRERGVYFSVDAIQGLGVLPLDVRECQIDFLAAGGFKWLMGPLGIGIFYCRQELVDRLIPVMVGWGSTVDHDDFYRYHSPLRPEASRFEEGAPNVVGIVGLGTSIKTLLEVGISNIEGHVLSITSHLLDGLLDRGYEVITPHECLQERSGIVSFRHPQHDTDELEQQLTEAGIVISKRGGTIRVAPHFYNTMGEMDRVLEVLP